MERERVAERNQLGGALRSLNRGNTSHSQEVTLGRLPFDDQLEGGLLHVQHAGGDRFPSSDAAITHIHHVHLTSTCEVGELISHWRVAPSSEDMTQHTTVGGKACHRVTTLVNWMERLLDSQASEPRDQWRRPLETLRLSLTARCNLACSYCQPAHQEVRQLLTLEQQLALIEACCHLGVRSLRLTGGEPLLSDQLEPLLQSIQKRRRACNGPVALLKEVALTSNGLLLDHAKAQRLRTAGLDRLTLSLDGLDAAVVADMAGLQGGSTAGHRTLTTLIDAIGYAREAGFDPSAGALKLNSVIQRGRNDHQVLPLAAFGRAQGIECRFIEFMDVGSSNSWSLDQVIPAAELIEMIDAEWPLVPIGRSSGGTANRWRYRDGRGVISVIASVSEPFCSDCNRARITADGQLYTCLFASTGLNLRPWLEPEIQPEQLIRLLQAHWAKRHDRYSEERHLSITKEAKRADMAYLGG